MNNSTLECLSLIKKTQAAKKRSRGISFLMLVELPSKELELHRVFVLWLDEGFVKM